jgi:hypothetical protein
MATGGGGEDDESVEEVFGVWRGNNFVHMMMGWCVRLSLRSVLLWLQRRGCREDDDGAVVQ